MIDFNNPNWQKKIKRAIKGESGMLLVEYLKYEFDKHSFDKIPIDIPAQEIATRFIAAKKVRETLTDVIEFLTR